MRAGSRICSTNSHCNTGLSRRSRLVWCKTRRACARLTISPNGWGMFVNPEQLRSCGYDECAPHSACDTGPGIGTCPVPQISPIAGVGGRYSCMAVFGTVIRGVLAQQSRRAIGSSGSRSLPGTVNETAGHTLLSKRLDMQSWSSGSARRKRRAACTRHWDRLGVASATVLHPRRYDGYGRGLSTALPDAKKGPHSSLCREIGSSFGPGACPGALGDGHSRSSPTGP